MSSFFVPSSSVSFPTFLLHSALSHPSLFIGSLLYVHLVTWLVGPRRFLSLSKVRRVVSSHGSCGEKQASSFSPPKKASESFLLPFLSIRQKNLSSYISSSRVV
ncbi:hypothetical protein CSUI_008242 [Cystoisospora suis]|uniref:Transmembrane protein n=1 Tax=Cystoisospora suis TaxID=483139 RepID=A0A2C6KN85_9APIC|nr:hypothetical protein CSUI_008242 [Cystoisospora suis]